MITPTSPAQRQATDDGTVPPLERIRDRVWAVGTAMPGEQPRLKYTLTYLLVDDDGRVHVVDPGWDTDANLATLRAALHDVGGPVGSIVVTHLHPDHLAMAPRLREETGAPIVLHELEAQAVAELADFRDVDPAAWGVPPGRWDEVRALRHARGAYRMVTPDVVVRGDVDRLNHPGVALQTLHTPGHTVGHICLRLPAEKLLLTGDHVLPAIYPGLGLGGRPTVNPIAAYLESLDLVAAFDDHEILPGHHYRFTGLAERIERTAAHHRRRSDEVGAALAADPGATVYRVAAALTWSGGWERMQGFLLYSALAQTAMHIDLLRSRSA